MRNGIGSHQSAKMLKDEWLTPPEIIKELDESYKVTIKTDGKTEVIELKHDIY